MNEIQAILKSVRSFEANLEITSLTYQLLSLLDDRAPLTAEMTRRKRLHVVHDRSVHSAVEEGPRVVRTERHHAANRIVCHPHAGRPRSLRRGSDPDQASAGAAGVENSAFAIPDVAGVFRPRFTRALQDRPR